MQIKYTSISRSDSSDNTTSLKTFPVTEHDGGACNAGGASSLCLRFYLLALRFSRLSTITNNILNKAAVTKFT